MGFIGCASFEVIGWKYDFVSIEEAGNYYKQIWDCCWVEDQNGKVIQRF